MDNGGNNAYRNSGGLAWSHVGSRKHRKYRKHSAIWSVSLKRPTGSTLSRWSAASDAVWCSRVFSTHSWVFSANRCSGTALTKMTNSTERWSEHIAMLRRAQVRVVPCWNSLSKASHWQAATLVEFSGTFPSLWCASSLVLKTCTVYIDFENGRWGISILLRSVCLLQQSKSSLPLCLPFCVQLYHLASTLAPPTNVYRCVHVPGLWREADRLVTKRAPRCSKQIV